MKEKTKHHKHYISAGFHPGIEVSQLVKMKERVWHLIRVYAHSLTVLSICNMGYMIFHDTLLK